MSPASTSSGNSLFEMAICTIFARECLEAAIIIGNYRTVVFRSQEWEGDQQAKGLRAITLSAIAAIIVAILVCVVVAIPLAIASRDLDEAAAEVIEGVSKIVAAICILGLSLKIPKWLGLYASKKMMDGNGLQAGTTLREIRFNVAWNIWREVAECGVFLIPFFLQGDGATAIPLSAIIGIVVGLGLGIAIYYANKVLKNKTVLAVFMSTIMVFLACGLFKGGCHEFEEVYGETEVFQQILDPNFSDKQLPMALLKPFGYDAKLTQLEVGTFWSWLALSLMLHAGKMWKSQAESDGDAEPGKCGATRLEETEAAL